MGQDSGELGNHPDAGVLSAATPGRAASAPDMAGAPAKNGSLPTLSLPKGGGAIRGIGEKFSANPVTSTGTMTVPISASPDGPGSGRSSP
jgi:hypothetical protein